MFLLRFIILVSFFAGVNSSCLAMYQQSDDEDDQPPATTSVPQSPPESPPPGASGTPPPGDDSADSSGATAAPASALTLDKLPEDMLRLIFAQLLSLPNNPTAQAVAAANQNLLALGATCRSIRTVLFPCQFLRKTNAALTQDWARSYLRDNCTPPYTGSLQEAIALGLPRALIFQRCTLEFVGNGRGMPGLHFLDLRDCTLSEEAWITLAKANLWELRLSQIKNIPKYFFHLLCHGENRNIRELVLDRCVVATAFGHQPPDGASLLPTEFLENISRRLEVLNLGPCQAYDPNQTPNCFPYPLLNLVNGEDPPLSRVRCVRMKPDTLPNTFLATLLRVAINLQELSLPGQTTQHLREELRRLGLRKETLERLDLAYWTEIPTSVLTDISQFPALRFLKIDSTPIPPSFLRTLVAKATHLFHLSFLAEIGRGDQGEHFTVGDLFAALEGARNLKELYVSTPWPSCRGGRSIISWEKVKRLPILGALEEFYLLGGACLKLEDGVSAEEICDFFLRFPKLRQLCLSSFSGTPPDVTRLLEQTLTLSRINWGGRIFHLRHPDRERAQRFWEEGTPP